MLENKNEYRYGHLFDLSDGHFSMMKRNDALHVSLDTDRHQAFSFSKSGKLTKQYNFGEQSPIRQDDDLYQDLDPVKTQKFVDNEYKKPPVNQYEEQMESGGRIKITEYENGFKEISLSASDKEMGAGKGFYNSYLIDKEGKLIHAYVDGRVVTNEQGYGLGGRSDIDPPIPPMGQGMDGPPPPMGGLRHRDDPPPPPPAMGMNGPSGPPPMGGLRHDDPHHDDPPPPPPAMEFVDGKRSVAGGTGYDPAYFAQKRAEKAASEDKKGLWGKIKSFAGLDGNKQEKAFEKTDLKKNAPQTASGPTLSVNSQKLNFSVRMGGETYGIGKPESAPNIPSRHQVAGQTKDKTKTQTQVRMQIGGRN